MKPKPTKAIVALAAAAAVADVAVAHASQPGAPRGDLVLATFSFASTQGDT